mmetsp:Transcript_7785/g.14022  ORF Transcript_7785/g.14022 Transcript_7785/m.14022 type:complete len:283 (+) Transcript_7785:1956-2804(+)
MFGIRMTIRFMPIIITLGSPHHLIQFQGCHHFRRDIIWRINQYIIHMPTSQHTQDTLMQIHERQIRSPNPIHHRIPMNPNNQIITPLFGGFEDGNMAAMKHVPCAINVNNFHVRFGCLDSSTKVAQHVTGGEEFGLVSQHHPSIWPGISCIAQGTTSNAARIHVFCIMLSIFFVAFGGNNGIRFGGIMVLLCHEKHAPDNVRGGDAFGPRNGLEFSRFFSRLVHILSVNNTWIVAMNHVINIVFGNHEINVFLVHNVGTAFGQDFVHKLASLDHGQALLVIH